MLAGIEESTGTASAGGENEIEGGFGAASSTPSSDASDNESSAPRFEDACSSENAAARPLANGGVVTFGRDAFAGGSDDPPVRALLGPVAGGNTDPPARAVLGAFAGGSDEPPVRALLRAFAGGSDEPPARAVLGAFAGGKDDPPLRAVLGPVAGGSTDPPERGAFVEPPERGGEIEYAPDRCTTFGDAVAGGSDAPLDRDAFGSFALVSTIVTRAPIAARSRA
jgi:hypothetical protein